MYSLCLFVRLSRHLVFFLNTLKCLLPSIFTSVLHTKSLYWFCGSCSNYNSESGVFEIRLAFYLLLTLFWFLLVSYYNRFQKILGKKKLLPFLLMIPNKIFPVQIFFNFFYMLAHNTAHVLDCFCFVYFHFRLGWHGCQPLQNFAPFSVIIWTCNVLEQLIRWANVSEHSNKKNWVHESGLSR